jgi:hypothetical protein
VSTSSPEPLTPAVIAAVVMPRDVPPTPGLGQETMTIVPGIGGAEMMPTSRTALLSHSSDRLTSRKRGNPDNVD